MGIQCRVMHQTANSKGRHQKAIEFLPNQVRHLASQDDPAPTQVGLQLVQSGFNFPALVLQGGPFFRRSLLVVEHRGDEPITRFSVSDTLQAILDHWYCEGVPFSLAILYGRDKES
jgi:hypothetical protein